MAFPTQTKQTEKIKSSRTEGKKEKKKASVVKLLSKISKVPRDCPGVGLLTSPLSPSLPASRTPSLSPYLLSLPSRQ